MPGFFNTHVHNAYNENNLKTWAGSGITTVRDLSTGLNSLDSALIMRDRTLKDPYLARIVSAGTGITVPEGYPVRQFHMDSVLAATPEEAGTKTEWLLNKGVDVIKIFLESGKIFLYANLKWPVLTKEEVINIIEAAHKRGTIVTAHVSDSSDLKLALECGVDDIAHMVTDELKDDELVNIMVLNNIYWVPTLELWKGVHLDRYTTNNLRRFIQAGGRTALGTDYAGYSMPFQLGMPILEMELMLDAGMTPMLVIMAGTKNAAHVCSREAVLGTLETNKIADIIAVGGNPLQDIHCLTNALFVMKSGVIIKNTLK